MKYNVLIKILIAFILLFAIFYFAYTQFLYSVLREITVNTTKTTSQGLLLSLEKQLIKHPKSQWNAIIHHIQNPQIFLTSAQQLPLNASQKNKLNAGKIITISGATYQFLNLVIVESTAYKKIGDTSDVLAYSFSSPGQTVLDYMRPTIQLIITDLLAKPKESWNIEAKKLEKTYSFAIHVYDPNSKQIPTDVSKTLSTKPIAFATNPNSTQIGTLYYPFNGSILKIGPIRYSAITDRITDLIYYFIFAFFLLTLFFITFLSILFIKNMKRIYQTTEKISHGDFNSQTKIRTTSVLYGLNENINFMGKKLEQLLESKKNMSRFVAHEIRTPLYTMQLALDSMDDTDNLSSEVEESIISLKEDIKQINDLVGLFLLYSQSSDNELKINKEQHDIKKWLEAIVKRHKYSNTKLEFHFSDSDDTEVYFDPKLLKHAVDNLIVNAFKFAHTHIRVSLQIKNNHITIAIDDDGPGIVDEDKEKAFEAFSTLGQSESFGGHIGLGLSIAKSVVDLHSGKINIENSALGGCRFVINIPNNPT